MPEPQPLALVDVRDRNPFEGVPEPVNDLARLVPDNHDQRVGAGLYRRLEDMRKGGSARNLNESLRLVRRQFAESTPSSSSGNARVHTRDATRGRFNVALGVGPAFWLEATVLILRPCRAHVRTARPRSKSPPRGARRVPFRGRLLPGRTHGGGSLRCRSPVRRDAWRSPGLHARR